VPPRKVILLGCEFLFNEELGSRLRGEGHIVHPYDNVDDLITRLNNKRFPAQLVIHDLTHDPVGGVDTIKLVVEKNIPILAIGPHKDTQLLDKARAANATKVIVNSQASKSIETIVKELLGSEQ